MKINLIIKFKFYNQNRNKNFIFFFEFYKKFIYLQQVF